MVEERLNFEIEGDEHEGEDYTTNIGGTALLM